MTLPLWGIGCYKGGVGGLEMDCLKNTRTYKEGEKIRGEEKEGLICKCRQILLQISFRGYLVLLVRYRLSHVTSKSLFTP